jgi:PemK-like, MazF-like toxin of type II toxin-antitoxin system
VATPAAGDVILVPFPFSDLTQSKLRPAIVLADAGGGDWILCQVTSNPYGDPRAIMIADVGFRQGGLPLTSFARPGKLFTANQGLVVRRVGTLKSEVLSQIIRGVVSLLQGNP